MGESPRGTVDTGSIPLSGMDATSAQMSHRNKRIKVLDAIVTCLQMKKPSWQKARILHLSTQLEDSIFNSKESLADYGDASTLPARINHHCLLLATRKNASTNPKAAGRLAPSSSAATADANTNANANGGVRSFTATPINTTTTTTDHHPDVVAGRCMKRGVSSSFVIGPPPTEQQDVMHGEAQDNDRRITSSSTGGVTGGGNGGGEEVARRRVQAERRNMLPGPAVYSDGSNAPHSSHGGETTEDDMNDDDDDDDDSCNEGDNKAKNATAVPATVTTTTATTTATSSAALLSRTHNSAPLSAVVASLAAASAAAEPATAPESAAANTTRAPPEKEGRNEEGDQEFARVEAVIAAASGGGGERQGAWSSEMHAADSLAVEAGGWVGGVAELFGNGQQHQGQPQPHPKATEEEVRQHALRLLQCRLLLLAHASTCSEEEGYCRLAPLCESVRELLRHMHSCGDTKPCGFPHCVSSKAVLQHKHMCTDSACGLCCSVKDISQKCFWANARHLHKRRLEESHELRRKKRQSEGKAVAPPRKLQAEKAKGGKEICSGLDEAGNDLGDISLGFFLRQDKAVKARKMLSQENCCDEKPIISESTILTKAVSFDTTPTSVGNKRGHEGVAKVRGSLFGGETPQVSSSSSSSSMSSPKPAHSGPQQEQQQQQQQQQQPPSLAPHLRLDQQQNSRGDPSAETQAKDGKDSDKPMDVEDVSGGAAEGSSIGASSVAYNGGHGHDHGHGHGHGHGLGGRHDGVNRLYDGPSGGVEGHLRSPSEIMLDDIAESLADTTRKPSFARMQSVQAFLSDHVELRESASFGDVSAMVEQWMSLEENVDDEHLDENGMGGAFSF